MAGFGEDGIMKPKAIAEPELSLESPDDVAERLKKLEASVETPAPAAVVETPQSIAEDAAAQAQKDATAYEAALANFPDGSVAESPAEEIPSTWDELGVDKAKLEKILLTDALTAADSPEAAEISDAEREENRMVRTKAERQLFQKLGSGTLSAGEKALLLQHVAKKTAWAHPSTFVPEAARKDEEVMRAVAQGSPAGAQFAKGLGFKF